MDKQNSKQSDPDVVLFGKDFSEKKRQTCDDGGTVWGILLIFAGIVLLLNTFSVIPWTIWERLWMYWPVLLILGGLHIVLGNSYISRFIITVSSVVLLGTVFLLGIQEFRPDYIQMLPPEVVQYLHTLEGFLKKP